MIKIDMEMPRTCAECPFFSGYHYGTCLASDLYYGSEHPEFDRHIDCPLQEVEDDGRPEL